uniref:Uncharacterized protein n=1 Tax=Rhizophora mucronata TaxID=61149 RepID=A0A2P2QI83_RHIMU
MSLSLTLYMLIKLVRIGAVSSQTYFM